ncbi:MAG TPA: hypothetical protein VMM13_07115 [Euzebya sp.]|nr:hypothetical protein [Euzebya sp.]
MFNDVGTITWLAVALSTAALTVLGGVSLAALSAKPHAQALGRDPRQPPEMAAPSYVGLRRWNRIPGVHDKRRDQRNFPGPLARAAVNGPQFALRDPTPALNLTAMRATRIETGVRFAAGWEEE